MLVVKDFFSPVTEIPYYPETRRLIATCDRDVERETAVGESLLRPRMRHLVSCGWRMASVWYATKGTLFLDIKSPGKEP